MTIHSYVKSVQEQYPDLAELLAPEASVEADQGGSSNNSGNTSVQRRGIQRVLLFEEHKPMSELKDGIRQGR